nr:PREDICTED: mucin-5AC-like [Bemisia tabaci]
MFHRICFFFYTSMLIVMRIKMVVSDTENILMNKENVSTFISEQPEFVAQPYGGPGSSLGITYDKKILADSSARRLLKTLSLSPAFAKFGMAPATESKSKPLPEPEKSTKPFRISFPFLSKPIPSAPPTPSPPPEQPPEKSPTPSKENPAIPLEPQPAVKPSSPSFAPQTTSSGGSSATSSTTSPNGAEKSPSQSNLPVSSSSSRPFKPLKWNFIPWLKQTKKPSSSTAPEPQNPQGTTASTPPNKSVSASSSFKTDESLTGSERFAESKLQVSPVLQKNFKQQQQVQANKLSSSTAETPLKLNTPSAHKNASPSFQVSNVASSSESITPSTAELQKQPAADHLETPPPPHQKINPTSPSKAVVSGATSHSSSEGFSSSSKFISPEWKSTAYTAPTHDPAPLNSPNTSSLASESVTPAVSPLPSQSTAPTKGGIPGNPLDTSPTTSDSATTTQLQSPKPTAQTPEVAGENFQNLKSPASESATPAVSSYYENNSENIPNTSASSSGVAIPIVSSRPQKPSIPTHQTAPSDAPIFSAESNRRPGSITPSIPINSSGTKPPPRNRFFSWPTFKPSSSSSTAVPGKTPETSLQVSDNTKSKQETPIISSPASASPTSNASSVSQSHEPSKSESPANSSVPLATGAQKSDISSPVERLKQPSRFNLSPWRTSKTSSPATGTTPENLAEASPTFQSAVAVTPPAQTISAAGTQISGMGDENSRASSLKSKPAMSGFNFSNFFSWRTPRFNKSSPPKTQAPSKTETSTSTLAPTTEQLATTASTTSSTNSASASPIPDDKTTPPKPTQSNTLIPPEGSNFRFNAFWKPSKSSAAFTSDSGAKFNSAASTSAKPEETWKLNETPSLPQSSSNNLFQTSSSPFLQDSPNVQTKLESSIESLKTAMHSLGSPPRIPPNPPMQAPLIPSVNSGGNQPQQKPSSPSSFMSSWFSRRPSKSSPSTSSSPSSPSSASSGSATSESSLTATPTSTAGFRSKQKRSATTVNFNSIYGSIVNGISSMGRRFERWSSRRRSLPGKHAALPSSHGGLDTGEDGASSLTNKEKLDPDSAETQEFDDAEIEQMMSDIQKYNTFSNSHEESSEEDDEMSNSIEDSSQLSPPEELARNEDGHLLPPSE